MRQLAVTVTQRQTLTTDLLLLTVAAPDLPQVRAGQLVLARMDGHFDVYMRAACFPIAAGSPDSALLLIDRSDLSHAQLWETAEGGVLDLLLPVGNGFTLENGTQRVLLIGTESHAAPLIALAREAAGKQLAVTLVLSSQSAVAAQTTGDWVAPLLPLDVEYQAVPDMAAALPGLLRWPDQICAAGDSTLYALLRAEIVRAGMLAPSGFVQVVVAPPMACGFGACFSCAVHTPRGMKFACVDGPVFALDQVTL